MLKLFIVAAIVIIVVSLIIWAFLKLSDKAKKSRDKTEAVLEANLIELKKLSAVLADMKTKQEKVETKKEV